jgi:uncharacterized radical SAM superfamily Fe-S cluster-containing enzyme
MELIKYTLSLCPECLQIIKAKIINIDGVITMEKECHLHGVFRSKHIWDSEQVYRRMAGLPNRIPKAANGLVLNLNTNCNINCSFCYIRANEVENRVLKIEQIKKILSDFQGDLIYLSGGEPTVSENLISTIKWIKKKGYKVGLFTNGKKLCDKSYVITLKKAGINFVILQFDSLNDKNYEFIRGEPLLRLKLQAIENLRSCKIPIYLFVMLIGEKNISEIGNLINFVLQKRDYVKIINFNPVWEIGRLASHKEITTSMILHSIELQTGITTYDFLDSTEFSYYLFDVLRKLSGKNLNLQPLCELRCYVIFEGNKIVPLSRFIDVKKINIILKEITKTGISKTETLKSCIAYLPSFSKLLWKSFLSNRHFRNLLKLFIKNILGNFFRISLLQLSPFASIIIGTFQTAQNLDFDTIKTCNLYSDYPNDKYTFSACVRQILIDKMYKKDNLDLDIDKLVDSYKKCLYLI